jgi:TolB-like protein/tetratricopeptide (TPR) repeat protein
MLRPLTNLDGAISGGLGQWRARRSRWPIFDRATPVKLGYDAPELTSPQMGSGLKYFFDSFVFDPDRRELRQGDAVVAMQPQVFDLLEYLIRNRDRVVSKEDIFNSVWGGRIVSESSLTSRINAARAVLGDSGEEQRLLRTLPRKGIRFVGVVREQGADAEAVLEPGPAAARSKGEDARPSIAVLPLVNLSGEADSLRFADALAEDVITELSRSPELLVVSRNSSFVYRDKSVDTRQIGQALGVKFVLEGSVRRATGRIRVVAQLIDANDGSHVWAERFDFAVDEAAATQDELTREIVLAVRSRLTKGKSVRLTGIERRNLTVVSCRLAGTAALADKIEPDAMRDLIEAYQRECLKLIAQFGGVAALRGGDEVEAYFGHPLANERSAECAVRTGLAIAEMTPRMSANPGALRASIGIGTGMAIAGILGPSADSRQSTAVGEPIEVARRLSAAPEGVTICGPTRRQIGGLFRYLALPIDQSEGEEAWRVTGEGPSETRFAALHGDGLSPLVGRDEELAMLARRWDAAKSGMGQVVLLRAEAGVGKSRLVQTLRESIHDGAHEIVHYACAPHRAETAFFPIIEQVARAAGLFATEDTEQKLARLERLLQLPASGAADVALIASLLSLPHPQAGATSLTPQKRKERIVEILLDHLRCLAGTRPLLIEFEDAHWVDSASLEYLTLLVERLHDQRILLIVTARPEFVEPWRDPEYGLVLNLSRLHRRNAADLAARVAGGHVIPPDVLGRILDRADGVPLFIEELTRAVIEGGQGGRDDEALTKIPPTLEGSLLARLDRLSIVDDLLEMAATLGRQFSHELIATLVPLAGFRLEASLERLVSSGLAHRRGAAPDAVYTFKHALVRDAIYSRLGASARRALHARVADVLEQKFPDTATSQPGLLAWHSLEGGAFAKAADYALLAGKQAMAVSAVREAVSQVRLGLAALKDLPKSRERSEREVELQLVLVTALVSVRGYTDPDTMKAYTRLSELCEQLGRTDQIAEIAQGFFSQALVMADFANALRICGEGSRGGRTDGYLGTGIVLAHQGRLSDAVSWFERAYVKVASFSRAAGASGNLNAFPVIGARTFFSLCAALQGMHARALELVADALNLLKIFEHPSAQAFGLSTITRVSYLLGMEEEHRAFANALARSCTEHGFSYWLATAECYQARQLALGGRPADGAAFIEGALRRHRETKARWVYPFLLGLAGEIDCMNSAADRGLGRIDEALSHSAQTGEAWSDSFLLRLRGEALRELGRLAEAEDCFVKALVVSASQGALVFTPAIAAELARSWIERGRKSEARELLLKHCRDLSPELPWVRGARQLLAELG